MIFNRNIESFKVNVDYLSEHKNVRISKILLNYSDPYLIAAESFYKYDLLNQEFEILATIYQRNSDNTYSKLYSVNVCDTDDKLNLEHNLFEINELFKSENRCKFPATIDTFTSDLTIKFLGKLDELF